MTLARWHAAIGVAGKHGFGRTHFYFNEDGRVSFSIKTSLYMRQQSQVGGGGVAANPLM
jgi:hypothetical protein